MLDTPPNQVNNIPLSDNKVKMITLSNQIRTLLAIMSALFSKRLGVMTPDVETPEVSLQSRMTFPVRVFSKMRLNTFNLDDNGFSPNQTDKEKIYFLFSTFCSSWTKTRAPKWLFFIVTKMEGDNFCIYRRLSRYKQLGG